MVGQLPDIFTQVRVLEQMDMLPNDGVSVRPAMDATMATELSNALQKIAQTSEGRAVLVELANIEDLQPASIADYDITRRLTAFWNFEFESCSEQGVATAASGGSVLAEDEEGRTAKVQIPAGAVSETLEIGLSPLSAVTHMPNGLAESGVAIEMQAVISGTTQIENTLAKPYELTAVYREDLLNLANEESLAWYYWDGQQWVHEVSSLVDMETHEVTAEPTHLSRWAVLGRTYGLYLPAVVEDASSEQ